MHIWKLQLINSSVIQRRFVAFQRLLIPPSIIFCWLFLSFSILFVNCRQFIPAIQQTQVSCQPFRYVVEESLKHLDFEARLSAKDASSLLL